MVFIWNISISIYWQSLIEIHQWIHKILNIKLIYLFLSSIAYKRDRTIWFRITPLQGFCIVLINRPRKVPIWCKRFWVRGCPFKNLFTALTASVTALKVSPYSMIVQIILSIFSGPLIINSTAYGPAVLHLKTCSWTESVNPSVLYSCLVWLLCFQRLLFSELICLTAC